MGKYRRVKLTQDKWTVVDYEDYKRVVRWNWQARRSSNKKGWYASRTEYAPKHASPGYNGPRRRTIQLANFIMQPPLGFEVDHINGDGLNNRKENLRICTRADNVRNVKTKGGRSGLKGAYWSQGAWVSRIQCKGNQYYLGRFKTDVEAATAYDKKARELYGAFARTNGLG